MKSYVWRSRLGLEDYFGLWHEAVATDLLFDAYSVYAKSAGERHPLSREHFGKFLVRVGSAACKLTNAVVGERLGEGGNSFGGTSRVAQLVRRERTRGYHVGSLQQARDAFQQATKLTDIEWPEGDDAAPDVF